jgi:hypothetical protein
LRKSVLAAASQPDPRAFDASAEPSAAAQYFEPLIAAVESHVHALIGALQRHEPLQVTLCAQALQTALLASQDAARRAPPPQALPPAMHQRLAIAAARATACREAMARTLAAQGRELKVLLPDAAVGLAVYDAHGQTRAAATPLGACA